MTQCDEIFQKIQRLEAIKRQLNSTVDYSSDPSEGFFARTKDGKLVELDFEDLWTRMQNDQSFMEWAESAAGRRDKPTGMDGRFENFGQLVDRLGFDNAVTTGAFMQKMTGEWAQANPADYLRTIAINDKESWKNLVVETFMQAGLDPSDRIVEAVAVNAAPFMDILTKQTKLEVFDWVTRNNLKKSIGAMRQEVAASGIGVSRELKQQFIDSYRKALFAHRSARLAKRRSGQLLQNYQRFAGGELTDEVQLSASLNTVMEDSAKELQKLTEESIGVTVAEMTQPDTLVKQVIEAANKGPAGVKKLEEIQEALEVTGVDPAGDNALDDGWEQVWRKTARAGYKDSVLFNPKTQLQANYISQKLVYLVDGYRTATGQGWDLYGRRVSVDRQGKQIALGELAEDTPLDGTTPQNSVKINPLATGFFRETMKAQLDGARIALEAATITNDVIRQTWKDSVRKGFFDADTPFAGNADSFSKGGTMSIEEQYKVAQSVMEEPFSKDPRQWPMEFRNKLHHGLKLLGNKALREATGIKLPVYSALQMMSAVDQRAGLRNYMTVRMNDLMLEQAALYPDRSLKDWSDAARAKADEQLYQATPTEQNIRDAREEFGLESSEITDDEVAEYLVAKRIGFPVLNQPGASKAYNQSVNMRMQGQVTAPGFREVNQAVGGLRRGEYGDSMISFWKSPTNQLIWDWGLGLSPARAAKNVVEIAGLAARGKEVPVELLVRAQGAIFTSVAMLGMFEALDSQDLVVGGGPLDPKLQRQFREGLANEGKVPNSIAGVPFPMGGMPIFNTLFLYKDLKDAIGLGGVSEWDQQDLGWDLVSVLAGSLLRMPGFAQIRAAYTALADGNPAQIQSAAAFWGNTQFNPVSGGERFGEWALGVQSSDLMRPQTLNTGEERFTLEGLPEGHPLKSKLNGLRDWLYYSNPGISYALGTQLKEKTWLGRDIRRPDGFFRGEWPIGVPGIWEFNKGDYFVEAQLEQLGQLDPPSPVMSGVYRKQILTEEGRKELMRNIYTYRAPNTAGSFEDYSRKHPNGLVFNKTPVQYETERGELPEQEKGASTDVTDLMNRITKGNTVREALNALFRSKEWAAWKADPLTTWDPSIVDLPPSQRNKKIGPWLVQQVKSHYTDMGGQQFELSGSDASNWWYKDLNKTFKTEEQDDALQGAFNAVNP